MKDIFRAFSGIVDHRRHKSSHKFYRIVVFQPGGLKGDNRIGGGMGFIKGILGKVDHIVVYFIGHGLADSIPDAARNVFLLVSVDKVLPFLLHHLYLFFGHGAAQDIASPVGIARQVTHDLHHLLLVNNAAVRRLENRLQLRTVIAYQLRMALSVDVLRNKIHRTRTVEGDTRNNVFQRGRLQFLHKALHSAGLQLKHAFALTRADHSHDVRIIVINIPEADLFSFLFLRQLLRVLNNRQGAKPQKVHLQQSQFLQCRHGKLGRNRAVRGTGERDKFLHRPGGNDHAGSMHGGVSGQSLQSPCHVNQPVDLLIALVELLQLLIHAKRLVNRNIQLIGNHLGDHITAGIRQIHHSSDIPDDTARSHRSKGNDLDDPVFSVLPHHIVNDLLPPLEAEIYINIRHGNTLRVQEPLKQKVVFQRIQFGDVQGVRNQAARRTSPPRSDHNVMGLCKMDIIPDDKEIVHIPHLPYDFQLIVKTVTDLLRYRMVALFQSLPAELLQICPGGIPFRNIELRQLQLVKPDLHMAALRNSAGILQSLRRIGKQLCHLLRGLYIILSSFVTHPVLVRKLLPCLDAKEDIVRLCVLRTGIVTVIGADQRNACLPAHTDKLRIDHPLLRYSVILKFQKEIAVPENLVITKCCFLCLFVLIPGQVNRDFSCKTGGRSNNPLMEFFQKFQIHTRAIVKSFQESVGDNFLQIVVALVVFCQQDQMIVPVAPCAGFPVKTGSRRHIDLTAQNRPDSLRPALLVEINSAVHHPVIGDGRAVHSQFFYPGYIFLYFIRAVQKTVLCMRVKMRKIHVTPSCSGKSIPIRFPDTSVQQNNFSFFQQMADCPFKCRLRYSEFLPDLFRRCLIVKGKLSSGLFQLPEDLLCVCVHLKVRFFPGRDRQLSIFPYLRHTHPDHLSGLVVALRLLPGDHRRIGIFDSQKYAEIFADFIDPGLQNGAWEVGRIGSQIRIQLHGGAEPPAFIHIQSCQHLIPGFYSGCLLMKRQKQILLQSPVQKRADP